MNPLENDAAVLIHKTAKPSKLCHGTEEKNSRCLYKAKLIKQSPRRTQTPCMLQFCCILRFAFMCCLP